MEIEETSEIKKVEFTLFLASWMDRTTLAGSRLALPSEASYQVRSRVTSAAGSGNEWRSAGWIGKSYLSTLQNRSVGGTPNPVNI